MITDATLRRLITKSGVLWMDQVPDGAERALLEPEIAHHGSTLTLGGIVYYYERAPEGERIE